MERREPSTLKRLNKIDRLRTAEEVDDLEALRQVRHQHVGVREVLVHRRRRRPRAAPRTAAALRHPLGQLHTTERGPLYYPIELRALRSWPCRCPGSARGIGYSIVGYSLYTL